MYPESFPAFVIAFSVSNFLTDSLASSTDLTSFRFTFTPSILISPVLKWYSIPDQWLWALSEFLSPNVIRAPNASNLSLVLKVLALVLAPVFICKFLSKSNALIKFMVSLDIESICTGMLVLCAGI